MARSAGFGHFTGKLKGLSFYRSSQCKGIVVRAYTPHSKKRIQQDAAFAGLRNAQQRLSIAAKMGKCIRLGIGPVIDPVKGNNLTSRLVKTMLDSIKEAKNRPHEGLETICCNNLRDFKFNQLHAVTAAIASPIERKRERGFYTVKLKRPEFKNSINYDFFKVVSSVIGIDFSRAIVARADDVTDMLKVKGEEDIVELNTEIPEGFPLYLHVVSVRQYSCNAGDKFSGSFNKRFNAADVMDAWVG